MVRAEDLSILSKKMASLANHYYRQGTPEGDLAGDIFDQLFNMFDDVAESADFRDYCERMGDDL